jgi:hypothetical protein
MDNEHTIYQRKLTLGKVDYNGSGRNNCLVTIEWELKTNSDETLTFTASGCIWNPRGTDIYLGGQILEEVAKLFPHHVQAQLLIAIWRRYHLNDMQPGCVHQRLLGWEKYDEHPSEPCPVCGYKYGSAWLIEEIPDDIIDVLHELAGVTAPVSPMAQRPVREAKR